MWTNDEREAAEHRYIEMVAGEIVDTLPENDGLARRALRHAERQRFANQGRPASGVALRLVGVAVVALLVKGSSHLSG
jgi:hypothetical protein